jgi:uncharacterized protein
MHKLVIDTNVLISALINPSGIPAKIFSEVVFSGKAQLYLSAEIIDEYILVINRPKFKKYQQFEHAALSLIMIIQEIAIVDDPIERVSVIKDMSDNKFLSLAQHIDADYLVTGNWNDFKMVEFHNTRILTPSEYYTLADSRKSDA